MHWMSVQDGGQVTLSLLMFLLAFALAMFSVDPSPRSSTAIQTEWDLVTRLVGKRRGECKKANRKETKYFLLRLLPASSHVFYLFTFHVLTSIRTSAWRHQYTWYCLATSDWTRQAQWIFEEDILRVELLYVSLLPLSRLLALILWGRREEPCKFLLWNNRFMSGRYDATNRLICRMIFS